MNWDPLHELVMLRERAARRVSSPDAAWTPSVDLLETDSEFVLVVELPGLSSADLSITATHDGIVLSGQRPAVTPPPQRYLRMERGHGRFSRTFEFNEPVRVNDIDASFDRGLLRITVPKATRDAERRIAIR